MPSIAKLTLGMPSRKKVKEIHLKAKNYKMKPSKMVIDFFNSLPLHPHDDHRS